MPLSVANSAVKTIVTSGLRSDLIDPTISAMVCRLGRERKEEEDEKVAAK